MQESLYWCCQRNISLISQWVFSLTWNPPLFKSSPHAKALFGSEVNSSTIHISTRHVEAPPSLQKHSARAVESTALESREQMFRAEGHIVSMLRVCPLWVCHLILSNLTLTVSKNLTKVQSVLFCSVLVLYLYLWFVGFSNTQDARPGPLLPRPKGSPHTD